MEPGTLGLVTWPTRISFLASCMELMVLALRLGKSDAQRLSIEFRIRNVAD